MPFFRIILICSALTFCNSAFADNYNTDQQQTLRLLIKQESSNIATSIEGNNSTADGEFNRTETDIPKDNSVYPLEQYHTKAAFQIDEPHATVYLIFSASCPYCVRTIRDLRKNADSFQINRYQIQLIPVTQYYSGRYKQQAALYLEYGLTIPEDVQPKQTTLTQVETNSQLFEESQHTYVPMLIYEHDGRQVVNPGNKSIETIMSILEELE